MRCSRLARSRLKTRFTDMIIGFQPCNSQMLATHKKYVDSFRTLYPINKNKTTGGILVGRYPEDTYFGGNPWYICTFACAELLYDAAAQINNTKQLTIDNYSLPFFQDIYPSAKQAVYTGAALNQILAAMQAYGDEFIAAAEQYTPLNGSLSEQINKTTGIPTSAYDLTWSFAAFVTMARRRSGMFPLPWGAMNVTNSTGSCKPGTYNATWTYKPARAAGAPTIKEACLSEVLFTVNATTQFVSSCSVCWPYSPPAMPQLKLTSNLGSKHLSGRQHTFVGRCAKQPQDSHPTHECGELHEHPKRMVRGHLASCQHLDQVSVCLDAKQ